LSQKTYPAYGGSCFVDPRGQVEPLLHLHQLDEAVRSMSNQLFLQAFATWELIIRTIREGTLNFVQRQPQELGDIGWVVDRKDRTITQMEETWSTPVRVLGTTQAGGAYGAGVVFEISVNPQRAVDDLALPGLSLFSQI
jgi:hypothetical protein